MVKEYESNIRELAGIPEGCEDDKGEASAVDMSAAKSVAKGVRFQLDQEEVGDSSSDEEDVFTRLSANFTNVWRAKLNELDRKTLKRPRSVLKEDISKGDSDQIDIPKRKKDDAIPASGPPASLEIDKENGTLSHASSDPVSEVIEKDNHPNESGALPRITWQSLSSLFSSKP